MNGKDLDELMYALRLKKSELSRMTGFTTRTIYNWIEKDKEIPKKYLGTLQEAFDKIRAERQFCYQDEPVIDEPIADAPNYEALFKVQDDKIKDLNDENEKLKTKISELVDENISLKIAISDKDRLIAEQIKIMTNIINNK